MGNMNETKRQYELIIILPSNLDGVGLDNIKKEIKETTIKLGGEIDFKEQEKRDLAYPINKQGQGIYLINQLSIIPEKVSNLSNELKLNKQVLRHLITQISIIKPEVKKAKSKKVIKKSKVEKKPSYVPTKVGTTEDKTSLKEIDKKLDEIIKEI